jgi:septal ring factor EnvC (AmiA/AmiB activator)
MRIKHGIAAAVLLGALAIGVASCQQPTGQQESRLRNIENAIARVDGVTESLSLLQSTDQGFAEELKNLKSSVDGLRQSVDALAKDVQSAKNSNASLQKKLDEISGKLGAVDQRLWVLEARYNDHLRRYHGG